VAVLSKIHPEDIGGTAQTYRSQDTMFLDYSSSQYKFFTATPITKYEKFSPLKKSGIFATTSHRHLKRNLLPSSILTL